MKAHELAQMLLEKENLPVYVRGYEGGVDDVDLITPKMIFRDYYKDNDYYGDHDEFPDNDDMDKCEPGYLLEVDGE